MTGNYSTLRPSYTELKNSQKCIAIYILIIWAESDVLFYLLMIFWFGCSCVHVLTNLYLWLSGCDISYVKSERLIFIGVARGTSSSVKVMSVTTYTLLWCAFAPGFHVWLASPCQKERCQGISLWEWHYKKNSIWVRCDAIWFHKLWWN